MGWGTEWGGAMRITSHSVRECGKSTHTRLNEAWRFLQFETTNSQSERRVLIRS